MKFFTLLQHVPVSSSADGNLFAEGIIDILPEHRHMGLSQLSQGVIAASGAVGLGSLFVVTPLTYFLGASSNPELVLTWSISALSASVAVAAIVSMRHWKIRADWSERLRNLVSIAHL